MASTIAPVARDAGATAELFANWADRPGLVQGGAGPGGPLYAWWLAKSGESTYAYSVEVARSPDGGTTWKPLGTLHADTTPAEHGFVTMVPEGAGVRAFWLDGRATAGGGPMALATVLVTDRIERDTEERLDDSVCDCCNTAAAVTRERSGGRLPQPHRRRGPRPPRWCVAPEGGWTRPAPLHRDGWKIAACPVNGPAIAISGDALWIAWFTAAEGRPQVLAARSGDGGRSFGDPLLVDGDAPSRAPRPRAGRRRRRHRELARHRRRGGLAAKRDAAIRLRRLTPDGRRGPVVEVARAEGSRATGVPRLLADGERLLVAWVDPAEGSRSGAIRIASLPARSVPPP